MKTFNKEDLKISLPDYISNSIEDNDLLSAIENELELNSEFRDEYNELKKTMNFLNSANLEAPSEAYFNNLSVRITQRMGKENAGSKESFWEKLSLFWKVLIPAISVILLIFVLYNIFVNDKNEVLTSHHPEKEEIEKNNISEKKKIEIPPDELKKSVNAVDSGAVNKVNEVAEKKIQIKKKAKISIETHKQIDSQIENKKEIEDSKLLIADNIGNDGDEDFADDEILEQDDEDSETIEDEFLELTPEEQKEILDNLIKSQI